MDFSTSTNKYKYSNTAIKDFGYIVWIIFACLSIYFYKERAAFMDGAFQLVNLINTSDFSIHHYRITNPLTQLFAWICVKFKLPLKCIMIGYSFNFVLFHLIIYHLIVKWCKNHYLGLVQVGFFTIFVTQSFYFVPPEFYQGMSILLLWTAILIQPSFNKKNWKYPVLILLLIPIIFDHALLSIFFLFIWIFLVLSEPKHRTLPFVFLLVAMVIIYFIHDLYFTGWYDEARKGHFWRHWNEYFPNFFDMPAHRIFFSRCLDTYYLFPISLFAIIIGYIRAYWVKDSRINLPILKLVLILGFCFFYLMINHINDPNTPFLFYSEVNYIGLAIPLMMSICFDFLPTLTQKKWIVYLITFILLIRVITIIQASEPLIDRHEWMLQLISENKEQKLYVKGSEVPKGLLLQTWAVPEETLLLTSLNGVNTAASLLIKRYDYKYNKALDSTGVFLRSHSVQSITELNNTYFNLGNEKYRKLEMKEIK